MAKSLFDAFYGSLIFRAMAERLMQALHAERTTTRVRPAQLDAIVDADNPGASRALG
jgi:hypothetical protein